MCTKKEISYMGHLPRITAEIVDILRNLTIIKLHFRLDEYLNSN